MITKDTTLVAYFKEVGSNLVESGKYSVAKIEVTNPFKDNEIFKLIEPSRTIKEAVYKSATRTVKMGNQFIVHALERPSKPTKHATQKEFSLWQKWNRISDEEKISLQLEKYAHDLNCEFVGFELI